MAKNQITETYDSVSGTDNLTLDVLAWRYAEGYRVRLSAVAINDVAQELAQDDKLAFATIRKNTSYRSLSQWRLAIDGEKTEAGYPTLGSAIRGAALHVWLVRSNLHQSAQRAAAEKREDESYAAHALRNGGSLTERLARRIAAVDSERAPAPYQHVLVSQGHRGPVAPATVHGVITALLQALRAEFLVGPIVEYSWTDADDTLTFRVQAGYWDRDDARRAQDVLFAGIGHLVQASVRRGSLEDHPRASEVEFAATIANNAHRAALQRTAG